MREVTEGAKGRKGIGLLNNCRHSAAASSDRCGGPSPFLKLASEEKEIGDAFLQRGPLPPVLPRLSSSEVHSEGGLSQHRQRRTLPGLPQYEEDRNNTECGFGTDPQGKKTCRAKSVSPRERTNKSALIETRKMPKIAATLKDIGVDEADTTPGDH